MAIVDCARALRCVRSVVPAILFGLLVHLASPSVARAEDALDRTVTFDIKENTPLEDALIDWGTQVGVTVMINSESVKHHVTHGISGAIQARKALDLILLNSGLSYTQEGDRIQVVPRWRLVPSGMPMPDGSNFRSDVSSDEAPQGVEQSKTANNGSGRPAGISEVIVTAQKREERIEDVPMPVTVLPATALTETNQIRLTDYYMQVPGLSVAPSIQSSQILTIRGLTTGGEGSGATVGILVDDVPFGGTGSVTVPDIDPSDLAQVEVLRGPQGTLYGASSLGGLIKFVTADPTLKKFSGRVELGTDTVHNGAEPGYLARASINAPLSDSIAIRASAYTRLDAGYIDNPTIGRDGINEARADGGHLSLLWKPEDTLSVKLGALFQVIRSDGTNEEDALPGLTKYQQADARGAGGYEREIQAYSVVVKDKIGTIDVSSVTGYNINSFHDSFDQTYALGTLYPSLLNTPNVAEYGAPVLDSNRVAKFSQELRAAIQFGSYLDWLIGGFYTHERNNYSQGLPATDINTGDFVASLGYISFPSTYTEYAGFTDFTFHITDNFQFQLGGRDSHIQQVGYETTVGTLFGDPEPVVAPNTHASANAFTYLVSPQYRFSANWMAYIRLASGYRPGGPNIVVGNIPSQYAPDKTRNYEIGTKGELFDRLLSFDVAAYYIDWTNIQVSLLQAEGAASYQFTGNGSRAKSEGVEISLQSQPFRGFKIGGWVAFNNAKLTEDFPPGTLASGFDGLAGDRLPYSSRFSANVSADEELALADSMNFYVGGLVNYMGDRQDVFTPTATRQDLPAYARIDLHSGIRYLDSWTVNLYANNVANRHGLISGGTGNTPPFGYYYIQPRQVGVNVVKNF